LSKANRIQKPPLAPSSDRIKEPSKSTEDDTNQLYPHFSFQYLDKDYCISRCTKEEKSALAEMFRIYGQKTWIEIILTSKNKNGMETIPQNQIKGKLPKIVTPDSELVVFRFGNNIPAVGHRTGRIFHLIWIDRNFNLYKH
jgi:hypothetical protein